MSINILGELFLYFLIYAFLGWILEVVFHIFTLKKLVNRGFLYGPLCPIYGFGASIMLLLLDEFKGNVILVFLLGMIAASVLEFITGYVLEYLFNAKWWDYSDMKYNIKGYISLSFSIMWGFASIFLIEILHPLIESFLSRISVEVLNDIIPIFFMILLLDCLFTVLSLIEFRELLSNIENFNKELIAKFQDSLQTKKIKTTILDQDILKIFENKVKDISFNRQFRYNNRHRQLLRSYPSLMKENKKKLEKFIKKDK